MSDIQIIQQKSVGYSHEGDSVYSTESYVKIAVSFKGGSLRLLKGAPLAVFICLALHEADSDPGASLSTIETETGYSSPTVIEAIRFLRSPDHRFIDEIGAEDDGTKRYRVSAYAWFGNGRKRQAAGKISLPLKHFTPVVDVADTRQSVEKEHQQQLFCNETRKIFHAAGIGDPALSQLARTVPPERAEMWADWLQDPPASFKRPSAYAVKRLTEDPLSEPPGWTYSLWRHWQEDEEREEAQAQAQADFPAKQETMYLAECPGIEQNALQLWHVALAELQLQMTKATFDTWVRSTHALGFDGDQLVVGVKSAYAVEWLTHRLQTTVERTVTGIVGHAVAIRYEANIKETVK